MLPLVFPLLRNAAAVAAIVGARIYRHGTAPQNVVAPYVTWFIVAGAPENALDEVPRIDRNTVQVDCWSDNSGTGSAGVEALAKAVRDAIEPTNHMAAIVADGRDFETQRYRIGMQFDFWTDRDP